ncbi:MAG: phasin family protein [Gammaproteobacteria bacterium]
MKTQNDTFTNFTAFQKEALEPIMAANTVAADAFERLSRQNYAVLGDYLNFAVEQARLPTQTTDYSQFVAKQMEHARIFGEQIARRSQEYVEIMTAFQAKAQAKAQATAQSAVQAAAQAPLAKAKAA